MIVVLGPTASGKTRFAVRLAREIDGEIISADSRQVYRGMDIGTGKDLGDYLYSDPLTGEEKSLPCHLVDIVDAGVKYDLFRYQRDFAKAYWDVIGRGKTPILCGGSGLYIEAVTRGYQLQEVPPDPELRRELEELPTETLIAKLTSLRTPHNTTDFDSRKRLIRALEIAIYQSQNSETPPLGGGGAESGEGDGSICQQQGAKGSEGANYVDCSLEGVLLPKFAEGEVRYIGISVSREERNARIDRRLHQRLGEGLVEEVEKLLKSGIAAEDLIYYGLEYKFVTLYLTGEISYEEMESRLAVAIHQFAKRQMTWFRGMERRGIKIEWIEN